MKKSTILIVDDEQRNIKLLKGMLISENYELHGFLRGEEALRALTDINPDLILLDVMMPGIDGFEVCRRLKQDENTRVIPVVMVTALRENEHRVRAMEVGADDFLSKPVDQTELLVRVKSLLRIKSYHDELLGSYREISEKNQRLEELERVKEGLTHMIIHDLNNPLMAISGTLEMVLMDRNAFSDRQLQRMEKCFSYCRDLNRLIQGLLDVYRMEEGQLSPVKCETDLAVLVDEVIDQFGGKIEEKKISLSLESSGQMMPVDMDREMIKRVLANLLGNATRHTPEGGKIEVHVDSSFEKGSVCFRVKDNGNGIRPEYRERVFEKFEQAGLKDQGVRVGSSGLGLAFCKMAVEAHGGRIWVESEGEGRGCAFCFLIPVSING